MSNKNERLRFHIQSMTNLTHIYMFSIFLFICKNRINCKQRNNISKKNEEAHFLTVHKIVHYLLSNMNESKSFQPWRTTQKVKTCLISSRPKASISQRF